MDFLFNALIILMAIEHVAFMLMEMLLWTWPLGRKVFGLSEEFANSTKALAANQGVYNGFLAAGLIWSLVRKDGGIPVRVFFLSCVIIAGVFGAITAKPSILYVQAAPALVALIVTLLAHRQSNS